MQSFVEDSKQSNSILIPVQKLYCKLQAYASTMKLEKSSGLLNYCCSDISGKL